MCGFFACKFILTQCKSIVSKRRKGCKGRGMGHSNSRNGSNQVYCRCNAPGGAPAALKRQKTNKSSKLPLKCPWRYSTATQTAETKQIKLIAAEVPLEGLQRHSSGRNQTNQAYCRCSAPGGAPAALKWQKRVNSSLLPPKCPWRASSGTQTAEDKQIKQIAAEVPLDNLQRHSNGSKSPNHSKTSKPVEQL